MKGMKELRDISDIIDKNVYIKEIYFDIMIP